MMMQACLLSHIHTHTAAYNLTHAGDTPCLASPPPPSPLPSLWFWWSDTFSLHTSLLALEGDLVLEQL